MLQIPYSLYRDSENFGQMPQPWGQNMLTNIATNLKDLNLLATYFSKVVYLL